MNQRDSDGCWNCLLSFLLAALVIAANIGGLFIIWQNGGLNYSVGATNGITPNVCPAEFDASMMIITQQNQTVICIYTKGRLTDERIEERGR
jgi:hypothetical protein